MLEKIPVLKKLRALELAAGKEVVLGPEPPVELGKAPRGGDPQGDGLKPRRHGRPRPRRNTQRDSDGEPRREGPGREGPGREGPGGNEEAVPKPRRRPARVRREGGRGDNQANGSEEGRERVRGERRGRSWRGSAGEGGRERKGKEGEEGVEGVEGEHGPPSNVTTVYLGGIPAGLRVSELKTALREKEALPLRLTWQGAQHRAFLDYGDPNAADQAMEALQGLSLNGQSLHAELAKNQRGGRRAGPSRSRPRSRPESHTKAEPNDDCAEPHKEEIE